MLASGVVSLNIAGLTLFAGFVSRIQMSCFRQFAGHGELRAV
jgi:hypothetical protein